MTELINKNIEISKEFEEKTNELVKNFKVESVNQLYRNMLNIGFVIVKNQLELGTSISNEPIHLEASKQANFHTNLLKMIADKLEITEEEMKKAEQDNYYFNHSVLAKAEKFHEIDENLIEEIKQITKKEKN